MRIKNFDNYIYEKRGDQLMPKSIAQNIEDIFQEIVDIGYEVVVVRTVNSYVVHIKKCRPFLNDYFSSFFKFSDVSEDVLRLLDYLSKYNYRIKATINSMMARRLGIEHNYTGISAFDITEYIKRDWINPNLLNMRVRDLEINLSMV